MTLARWAQVLRSIPASAFLGVMWAVAVLPHLSVRSFMWEEGNNAVLARDLLTRHDWWAPAIFGLRYVERPPLFAWLIAGTARWTGRVDEWSARLPAMLAVLGTALLVERLTRRYTSARAALFAAVAFLFSPMILRKLTISEPDTLVTFLSFSALVVWWDGEAKGRVTTGRWLACGGLLTALALTKGPQPLGFFALGVGGFLVARRRWTDLGGLACALALPMAAIVVWAAAVYRTGDLPAWLDYMRLEETVTWPHYLRERLRFAGGLTLDLLPGTLVVASGLVSRWKPSGLQGSPSPILRLLIFYAGLCTLAVLVWPGAKTRYAMPMAPAMAAVAGLTVEPLWQRRHWSGAAAVALAGTLFAYQVAFVTLMPPFTEGLAGRRHLAAAIDIKIREAPAPLFTVETPQSNKLFYVTWPIRELRLPEVDAELSAPAWVLASRRHLERIETLRPDLAFQAMTATLPGPGLVLARVERRPGRLESLARDPRSRP